MPHLIELFEKHQKDGLVILGIHSQSGHEKAAEFVKDKKIPYPIALDINGKTVEAFGADSFPDYYLIDRSGQVRVADLANGGLDDALKTLLAEPAPKSPEKSQR